MKVNIDDLNLQTGDILLYHEKDFWFSSIVEWFTGSQYSHIAMVLKDPSFTCPPLKGLYIFESGEESIPDAENGRIKFGVQIVPLKEVVENYDGRIYLRRLKCDRNMDFYLKLAKAHSNVHNITYDTNAHDMEKAVRHYYKGDVQKQTEYWCSALQAYLFTQLGFLPNNTPWTLILPVQFSSTGKDKLEFVNCELEKEVLIHDSKN